MNRTVRDANGREFPAYEPTTAEVLRKPSIKQCVLVDIEHIPEHYDIRINNISIDKYSNEELFSWIADIEAEMMELERINNRPIALAKLLDDKRTSIQHIIAWMNCRK